MGEIIFNGYSSKDVGLEVETFPSYLAPRRSYEKIHIPGRNGDLILDGNSWENVTRSYVISRGSLPKWIPYALLGAPNNPEAERQYYLTTDSYIYCVKHYPSYYQQMNAISVWLHSTTTYARLEDSYEPDCYRLAVFLDEFSPNNIYNEGGKAVIEFDCKPQRYLKRGDLAISISEPTVVTNPTPYESLPIIKVFGKGKGELTVGNHLVSISEIGDSITIDSELQDAYAGTLNKNQMISIPSGFPRLGTGDTSVSFTGGITRVEVTPKWYTI